MIKDFMNALKGHKVTSFSIEVRADDTGTLVFTFEDNETRDELAEGFMEDFRNSFGDGYPIFTRTDEDCKFYVRTNLDGLEAMAMGSA